MNICVEHTGLNERFERKFPNGEFYWEVRQFWTEPKYIQHTIYYRNITYKPLPEAFHDLDLAMYWFCKEAAKDIEYNLQSLHSAKILINVSAQYESANPDTPNFKSFP